MTPCAITLEMWIETENGRADADAKALIRAHDAQNCPQCRTHRAWTARFAQALREVESGESAAIPADATERACALFRETFVRPRRPQWLARLIFDSQTQARPAFARSGGGDAAHQRLYRAENCHVELWQEGNARDGWHLIGQVMPTESGAAIAATSVTLIAADGAARRTEVEENEFHLDPLPAGTYQIQVRAADGDILLPDVPVGV